MKNAFLFFVVLSWACTVAQAQTNYKVRSTGRASYPQGDEAFYMMMMKSIDYPQEAIQKRVQGIVQVSYVVGKDGKMVSYDILDSLGYGIDEEVIRILKTVEFIPGKANGEPVRSNRIDRFQLYARDWKRQDQMRRRKLPPTD